MDSASNCPLAPALATRLRAARDELTTRWLERIAARVTLDVNQIFPTDALLDHVPILVDGIASYIENPADDVTSDASVIAKAMELGEMRYQQGFDAYQILKEYEILGSVIFSFLAGEAEKVDVPCTRHELLQCGHRVFSAVALIQQATATQFLRQSQTRIREREDRLRGFNRTVTHELKSHLGATVGAVSMLREAWLNDEQRTQFLGMAAENLELTKNVLDDLVALSKLDHKPRQQRNVRLPEAVAEVRRRLRSFAKDRQVDIQVDGSIPDVEVDAAAVELCLSNYISNAVKYSDPRSGGRWVRIEAQMKPSDSDRSRSELIVRVLDNGVGVPDGERSHVFEPFVRADQRPEIEGSGLGLSIVRETIDHMGGRVWAEPNDGGGSIFAFALPARRSADGGGVAP
jgi:signal transduction histidine kinase